MLVVDLFLPLGPIEEGMFDGVLNYVVDELERHYAKRLFTKDSVKLYLECKS